MGEPRPAQCPNPELHEGHTNPEDGTWCAGLDGSEVPRPGSTHDVPCPDCLTVACPSCRVPVGTACTVTRPDLYGPTHADRRDLAHR